MSRAKIGMNTEYCRPNMLIRLTSSSAERIGRSLIAKRNPCTKFCSGEPLLCAGLELFEPHHQQRNDHGQKTDAVQEKTPALADPAMAKPAMAGPTTRAPLKMDEFSAMAFGRSSFPTI